MGKRKLGKSIRGVESSARKREALGPEFIWPISLFSQHQRTQPYTWIHSELRRHHAFSFSETQLKREKVTSALINGQEIKSSAASKGADPQQAPSTFSPKTETSVMCAHTRVSPLARNSMARPQISSEAAVAWLRAVGCSRSSRVKQRMERSVAGSCQVFYQITQLCG